MGMQCNSDNEPAAKKIKDVNKLSDVCYNTIRDNLITIILPPITSDIAYCSLIFWQRVNDTGGFGKRKFSRGSSG
jgi:hypothetical protein